MVLVFKRKGNEMLGLALLLNGMNLSRWSYNILMFLGGGYFGPASIFLIRYQFDVALND